ncbi:hypothetical protein FBZ99_12040 [Rhizobium sp. ERR 1071]|uniref:hypothetical protein n=1 Tax=unclassified Rhizobium TaxID=2613769 RepID=UPI000BA8940A|nr:MULTISPECIES: hypothetical protein [unclassified Rhizobium]ASW09765.1 hypothetical protein CKA34_27435 [Rhizobium sp. 11515TR]TWB08241.1 hypothetical protein FBZ99_12040 [Rhizobium sp. ERR1071]
MLENDEASTIPYTQLDHSERLDRVDFLATTISNLAFDVASDGDAQTVRSLLDIGWMLKVMRQDLAICCSSSNMAILGNAVTLIRALQTRCQARLAVGTIH